MRPCIGTQVTWNGDNVTQVVVVREVMRPKPAAASSLSTAPVGALLVELFFDERDTVHLALRDSLKVSGRLTVRSPGVFDAGVAMNAVLDHFTVILKPSDPPRAKLLFRPA